MAIYDIEGNVVSDAFDDEKTSLNQVYDVRGNGLFKDFDKTILPYDTNYLIDKTWLRNALVQRDAMITAFANSNSAIPFFIQTDGHGKLNDGNKGCHNLAEKTLRYIRNIQLGDYASYYGNGSNPTSHSRTSAGIVNYIGVMGNHEFLNNNSATAELADLPKLIASYTPSDAVLGSETYGCYKVIDNEYKVKWLVTQPHIPNENDSKGFVWKIVDEQYEWIIDELESDDGYDIVVVQHEPLNGTYTKTDGTGTAQENFANMSIGEILSARKSKTSGTYKDYDNIVHSYDFRNVESDLLCSLHGHAHKEMYMVKSVLGFPVYVADWFGNAKTCCYGLIDREHQKLMIWKFSSNGVANVLELNL